jgi:hypothetical protein
MQRIPGDEDKEKKDDEAAAKKVEKTQEEIAAENAALDEMLQELEQVDVNAKETAKSAVADQKEEVQVEQEQKNAEDASAKQAEEVAKAEQAAENEERIEVAANAAALEEVAKMDPVVEEPEGGFEIPAAPPPPQASSAPSSPAPAKEGMTATAAASTAPEGKEGAKPSTAAEVAEKENREKLDANNKAREQAYREAVSKYLIDRGISFINQNEKSIDGEPPEISIANPADKDKLKAGDYTIKVEGAKDPKRHVTIRWDGEKIAKLMTDKPTMGDYLAITNFFGKNGIGALKVDFPKVSDYKPDEAIQIVKMALCEYTPDGKPVMIKDPATGKMIHKWKEPPQSFELGQNILEAIDKRTMKRRGNITVFERMRQKIAEKFGLKNSSYSDAGMEAGFGKSYIPDPRYHPKDRELLQLIELSQQKYKLSLPQQMEEKKTSDATSTVTPQVPAASPAATASPSPAATATTTASAAPTSTSAKMEMETTETKIETKPEVTAAELAEEPKEDKGVLTTDVSGEVGEEHSFDYKIEDYPNIHSDELNGLNKLRNDVMDSKLDSDQKEVFEKIVKDYLDDSNKEPGKKAEYSKIARDALTDWAGKQPGKEVITGRTAAIFSDIAEKPAQQKDQRSGPGM